MGCKTTPRGVHPLAGAHPPVGWPTLSAPTTTISMFMLDWVPGTTHSALTTTISIINARWGAPSFARLLGYRAKGGRLPAFPSRKIKSKAKYGNPPTQSKRRIGWGTPSNLATISAPIDTSRKGWATLRSTFACADTFSLDYRFLS
jgi:hypothetical protein